MITKTTEGFEGSIKASSCMSAVVNGAIQLVRAARPVVPGALKALVAAAAMTITSVSATTYDFLLVTTNATSATFTSTNANGFITATTGVNFPTNALALENNSVYTSKFTNLFLASGPVQGW